MTKYKPNTFFECVLFLLQSGLSDLEFLHGLCETLSLGLDDQKGVIGLHAGSDPGGQVACGLRHLEEFLFLKIGHLANLFEPVDGLGVHRLDLFLAIGLDLSDQFIVQNRLFGIGPEVLFFAFRRVAGVFGLIFGVAFLPERVGHGLHDQI